jgi:hypothetical protein
MPFCPQCRFEYTAGVSRCPDCGSELVDSLPAEEPAAQSDFAEVELCVVADELQATLLQNALAGQGIPSRLRGASPHPAFDVPGLRPTFGLEASTAILVRRSDLARARVVYEDLERRGAAEEEVQDEAGSAD